MRLRQGKGSCVRAQRDEAPLAHSGGPGSQCLRGTIGIGVCHAVTAIGIEAHDRWRFSSRAGGPGGGGEVWAPFLFKPPGDA